MKQQARNAGGSGASSTTGDFFNKGHDPINQMQNSFAELGINKEQPNVSHYFVIKCVIVYSELCYIHMVIVII